jgi:putative endonuclease
MYYFYILYNSTIDKFYIGQTSNLELRLNDHNKTTHKVKFTAKSKGMWSVVYKEPFKTRSEAMKREKYVKSWKSRKKIKELINFELLNKF